MSWLQKCIGPEGSYGFRCLGCHKPMAKNAIYFVKENGSGTHYSKVDDSFWQMAFCSNCALVRGIACKEPDSGYSIEDFNTLMNKIDRLSRFVEDRLDGFGQNNPNTKSNIQAAVRQIAKMASEIDLLAEEFYNS